MNAPNPPLPKPAARRLRVYAFDPYAALDLGSAKYSHATISLAWEDPTEADKLGPGPVNDYLEVIDVDPTSRQFYEPLDLDAPEVLGQDGLPPSEGDPRFHQQMVFAVVMKTIKLFERALGRKIIWRPQWDDKLKTYVETRKLRVYPHAIREANAYYSPSKRALLFGYFNASQRSAGASWIFTALSHDIIVHETTHAILDGLHPRYSEATSPDSLAFHEAFADIAALFSHFQLYEAVYDYIDKHGRLNESGLLSGLAGQFARGATGRSALRDYIDTKPDADRLAATTEPHERGAILVAAVFDAFLSIYTARTEDLFRLSGTRLGAGQDLHPDLVARLTKEAAKSADHVLRMCIRALDYLPPVDVRFGEFLRAIVTADADLIPDDRLNYRLAFVEAFRRRGIFPDQCLSMSPDNLLWDPPPPQVITDDVLEAGLELTPVYRRSEIPAVAERNRRKVWYWLSQPQISPKNDSAQDKRRLRKLLTTARNHFSTEPERTAGLSQVGRRRAVLDFVSRIERDLLHFKVTPAVVRRFRREMANGRTHFDQWERFLEVLLAPGTDLMTSAGVEEAWEQMLGLYFQRPADRARKRGDPPSDPAPSPLSTIKGSDFGLSVEVHSVRTTRRAGPDGQDLRQLVIEVTQRRQGYYDPDIQAARDGAPPVNGEVARGDFVFRGGATLIIDLRDGQLRYVIRKSIADEARLDVQRRLLLEPGSLSFTYARAAAGAEPFALLHRD